MADPSETPNARPRGIVRRSLHRIGHAIDASRRIVLNLGFLLLLAALGFSLWHRGAPALADKTVLVLDLKGPLVEQASGNPQQIALARASGQVSEQTVLRDVLAALDVAAKDPKIVRVLLALDDFQGGGPASLRELAAAIERFKASGKPVSAWGGRYSQRQYFVAAHADEVLLHPFGAVYIDGYGGLRNYYREAFDRLGVSANVVRVGKYKNAAEPYFASAPSPATIESDKALYDNLWSRWTADVEAARKLEPGSIAAGIEDLSARLAAAGGDPAQMALANKAVDALQTRDEMRKSMIERGAADDDKISFRQIAYGDYLARHKPKGDGDAVGVVVAEGEIGDGLAPSGSIGGRSTAELIRKARDDAHIKAIVLRVNSPGGSVFGSELIRRELELARAAGKPVVVSMGDLAASGGYWISTASDEVIADPATITGSIGVFAMLPTAEGAMDKLSLHAAGYGTTWLKNAYDPRKPLDPRFAAVMQQDIDHIYATFTGQVAVARKSTPEKIDAIAQGRVWTGEQALERGLVDKLGSYRDALQAAATRGKLPEGFRVSYIERDPSPFERVLNLVGGSALGNVLGNIGEPLLRQWAAAGQLASGMPPVVAQQAMGDLAWLNELMQHRQPYAAVVHCLCAVE